MPKSTPDAVVDPVTVCLPLVCWLSATRASLHGAIDNATGKVLGLFFRPTEDLIGYLDQALRQIITSPGIPPAVYSDRHTLLFPPDKECKSTNTNMDSITSKNQDQSKKLHKRTGYISMANTITLHTP